MTLESLKDFWQDISLKHKDVKQFLVGNNYDSANNTNDKYPLVFYEMPYTITYPDLTKQKDVVTFALSVFLSTKQDDILDAHQAISFSKSIGDAIISKVKLQATEFTVDSANAISVREYSDDSVSGMRWDLTVSIKRDICEKELDDYFNE